MKWGPLNNDIDKEFTIQNSTITYRALLALSHIFSLFSEEKFESSLSATANIMPEEQAERGQYPLSHRYHASARLVLSFNQRHNRSQWHVMI